MAGRRHNLGTGRYGGRTRGRHMGGDEGKKRNGESERTALGVT